MFAGHIEVLGGRHVARGPDFVQACTISLSILAKKSRLVFIDDNLLWSNFRSKFIVEVYYMMNLAHDSWGVHIQIKLISNQTRAERIGKIAKLLI